MGYNILNKKPITKTHPKIAEQWHPTKNKPFKPSDFTYGSSKKVWWVCNKGHEWEALINSRTNGRGCPYCSNKKVTKSNSLAFVKPYLSKEWSYKKNGKLTPNHVVFGSNKKVWWVCKNKHQWKTSIAHRVLKITGCPYCANRKVTKSNSLAFVNPILSKEWNYNKNGKFTPNDVVSGSHIKVWWVCKRGHEWEAKINSRTSGTGCPFCSNKKATISNSIAFLNPKLAREWNYNKNGKLTPNNVVFGSHKKAWWVCSKGHEWEAIIKSRTRGNDCPYCSNKKVTKSNSLAFVNPILSKEWNYNKNGKFTPNDVVSGSHIKVWWVCKRGHEWEAIINSRTSGTGCPFCSWHVSKSETRIFSELKYLFSETNARVKLQNKESDIFIPSLKVSIEYDGFWWHKNKKSKDLAKSKLFLKHGILPIRIRGRGLKRITKYDIINQPEGDIQKYLINKILLIILKYRKIENNKLLIKIDKYLKQDSFANNKYYDSISYNLNLPSNNNSLKYLFPKLSKEWNYKKNGLLKPENYSKGSNENVWWICKKDHEWRTSILHRTRGQGCPYCSNRKVTKSNSLAFVNPNLSKEWNYKKNGKLNPIDVVPGSNKKVWWICKRGHIWKAVIYSRTGGNACPYCSNKKVTKSNSLAFVNPILSKEWNYNKNGKLNPNDVVFGSHKKVWWVCSKGHEWEAIIYSRSNGRRCPVCYKLNRSKSNR